MNTLNQKTQNASCRSRRSAALNVLSGVAMLSMAAGLAFSPAAQAGFIIEYDSGHSVKPMAPSDMATNLRVLSAPPANINYGNLVQRGYAPTNIAKVSTDGRNDQLIVALPKVVPANFRAYSRIPKNLMYYRTSFKGGDRAWPAVLDEILKNRRLAAVIDWDRSEVTFVKDVKEGEALK